MTTENDETEIKNPAGLLAKNKALLARNAEQAARITELEGQLQQAQEAHAKAVETAQAGVNEWKERWHKDTVLKRLEADLRGAAAGPWQYLRDTCLELGILKMIPGEDGLERPQWFDGKGNPAEQPFGLWKYLSDLSEQHPDLGHCLRASGIQGGGATGSQGSIAPAPAPAPTAPPAPPAFGLR